MWEKYWDSHQPSWVRKIRVPPRTFFQRSLLGSCPFPSFTSFRKDLDINDLYLSMNEYGWPLPSPRGSFAFAAWCLSFGPRPKGYFLDLEALPWQPCAPTPVWLSHSHSRQLTYHCSCLIPAESPLDVWYTFSYCPSLWAYWYCSPCWNILHTNTAFTLGPSSEVTSLKKASLISGLEKYFLLEMLPESRTLLWMWFFFMWICTEICENVESDTVGVCGAVSFCISNMLAHDADASGLWWHVE